MCGGRGRAAGSHRSGWVVAGAAVWVGIEGRCVGLGGVWRRGGATNTKVVRLPGEWSPPLDSGVMWWTMFCPSVVIASVRPPVS